MFQITDQATLRTIAQAYNTAVQTKNWAPAYQLIVNAMQVERQFLDEFGQPTSLRERNPAVDPAVYLWVEGALKVNTGDGAFATYIRDYTIRQHQLRSGESTNISQLIQDTSNLIAQRFVATFLGFNLDLGSGDGQTLEPPPPRVQTQSAS
jgi:hypothetical protein